MIHLNGLSSTVIDNLRYDVAIHRRGSTCLAYFYFDFRDPSKQSCQSLLLSLIRQLLDHCTTVPVALQNLHHKCFGQRSMSIHDLQITFRRMLESFQRTYIIIDALDECHDDQWQHIASFLANLCEWSSISDIHVLLTSRPEPNIKQCLNRFVPSGSQIVLSSESGISGDIQRYISSMLRHGQSDFNRWNSQELDNIENHLLRGANGMYV